MKIKSLLLITLCAASSVQAGETKSWGQWLKSGLFAAGKGVASRTGHIFSKISTNPLVEKYKKQAAIVGGVAVVGTGAVWYGYKWNKKRIKNHTVTITKNKLEQEKKHLKLEINTLEKLNTNYKKMLGKDASKAYLTDLINKNNSDIIAKKNTIFYDLQMQIDFL